MKPTLRRTQCSIPRQLISMLQESQIHHALIPDHVLNQMKRFKKVSCDSISSLSIEPRNCQFSILQMKNANNEQLKKLGIQKIEDVICQLKKKKSISETLQSQNLQKQKVSVKINKNDEFYDDLFFFL